MKPDTFLTRTFFHGHARSAAAPALAAALSLIIAVALAASPVSRAAPAHESAKLEHVNVNDGFAELVRAVKPAVVNISVTGKPRGPIMSGGGHFNFRDNFQNPRELERFFHRFFGDPPQSGKRGHHGHPRHERRTMSAGSGFIIDAAGLVVTNYHVIEHAREIEVVLDDGVRLPATLRGADRKTDLALLEIDAGRELPYLAFGDSDAAEVGDWVIAIGNPFGLGGTTTSGIISARGRDINAGPLDDFIQIDAPINRGNSGGPLFNTRGQVIGVNSAIFSPNGGSVGIGFAIPASIADNVISQLADGGVVQRGYLGVHIQRVSEDIADNLGLERPTGALVTEVIEDTPAQRAGIEAGDVILEFDGQQVDKMRDLPRLVALTGKGAPVQVTVWRDGESRELDVVVDASDGEKLAGHDWNDHGAQPGDATLGMKFAELDGVRADRFGLDGQDGGVVITDVDPQGPAAGQGLRGGDLIRRVDRTEVETPNDVINAIEASRKSERDSVLMLVERNQRARFVVVPVNA